MSDPHPGRYREPQVEKRSFLRKLVEFVHPGPDSTDELISTLAEAESRDLIAPESRMMLELSLIHI